jgi:hypothetical protein
MRFPEIFRFAAPDRKVRLCRISVLLVVVFWLVSSTATSTAQNFVFSGGGGAVGLSITTAVAGSEPTDDTDASTQLSWDADYGITAKITVMTIAPGQSFNLFMELNITSSGTGTIGTEVGEIQLTDGMAETDILRDIPSTSPGRIGSASITYRANASAAMGNDNDEGGADLHTITYTLTAQ